MEFYNTDEIKQIIRRSANILGIKTEEKAIEKMASRSRFTPRVANRLLKRCRDFAQVHKKGSIDKKTTGEALKLLKIDEKGLETSDRNTLLAIINKFGGGPVGLQTLAAATAEDVATIEEVYEPYLIQLGFIERTPRGRVATPHAYQHLNIPYPGQDKLL